MQITECLEILFKEYNMCTDYIRTSNDVDTNELYYYFGQELPKENNNEDRTCLLDYCSFEHDCVQFLNHRILPADMWISLNEPDIRGVVIFFETGTNNDDIRSIIFGTENKMTLRSYKYGNSTVQTPSTQDEFFNLIVLHKLDITLEQIQMISEFLSTNKKLIDDYKITLELS